MWPTLCREQEAIWLMRTPATWIVDVKPGTMGTATIVSPFLVRNSKINFQIKNSKHLGVQSNRFQTTSAAMPLRYRKRHWQIPCRFLQWPASSPSLRPSKSDHGAGVTVSSSLSCSLWDRALELISVHCAEKTRSPFPLRFRPRRRSPPTPSRRP